MRFKTLAWLGLALSLVACRDRSGGGGGPDAGGGGGGDDGGVDAVPIDAPGLLRVQDVQSDKMPVGTGVKLKGVVVTAIDAFGARTGDMWVEDPAGGAFSGVKVFGAPLDQVALLAVGDMIDIEGAVKDEFALTTDTSGRKVTELKPASSGSMVITKRGAGTVPAPAVVDAAAISMLDKAGRDAEWEKWEGVLITVINARQTGAFNMFGSKAVDQTEFRISGYARVQSVLAALPVSNAFGVCYDRITGVGDYFFNDLLLPRSTADVVAGGAGCRPMSTSVGAVQTQVSPEAADLASVYITAIDNVGTSKGVWVADALAAEASHGVYVFTGSTLPANVAIGATVNVQGTVDEFDLAPAGGVASGDTVTEVTNGTVAVVAAPGTTLPTPLVVAPATLSDIGAAGEPYEGVLVQVTTVKVTAALANGQYELTANDNSKIIMDDEAFQLATPLVVGTCYGSVTGLMHVEVTANIRTLNPRALTDFVDGTGCN